MAGEILIFDAAASNIDGTDPGTALEVGPNDDIRLREFDAPAPPQTVQYAGSVDTEGSIPASRKYENRVITLKLLCMTAASLRSLQAKIGKLAREGGTLKWILPGAETVIFDVLAADTFAPTINKVYYVRSGAFCEVDVVLPAKPGGRGTEQDLGDNVETTLPCLVFTETGVKGDMPGLGRLVIDNDSASTQRVALWGIQSRYYSSASTAALFYQAESCALSSASVATGPAGASGGVSNNTAFYGSLPATDPTTTIALIYLGASSTAQTHIGTFRVFVRAYAPNTNSGIVSLRAAWQPALGQSEKWNDLVQLATSDGLSARGNEWLLVDLGQINLAPARAGSQGWLGYIDGSSTSVGDDIYLDWIMLVPVDEGSGQAIAPRDVPDTVAANGSVYVRHDSVLTSVTGGYQVPLQGYEGDYLLVPPAGLESRTTRVIVKLARGDGLFGSVDWSGVVTDTGTDDISARLFVTPRYLVVPEP